MDSSTNGVTLYLYNASDERVAKGTGSFSCNMATNGFTLTHRYVLDLAGRQMTEYDGADWQHANVFALGQLLATYSATGTPLTFALNDWLGTKRVQAKSDGELDMQFLSLPYGDNEVMSGSGPNATEHFFTGKVRDAESGNDYFRYRYYSSSDGRWLRPDPSELAFANPLEPQTLNLYSYVGNAPLTRVDLLGLCWRGFAWACHLWNRTVNLVEGNGFHTDTYLAFHPNSKKRQEEYMKETGAADSGHHFGLVHRFVCMDYADLLDTASAINKTVGEGIGGSAGAGTYSQGFAISLGIQVVADPKGNLGLAGTFGAVMPFGGFVQGVGAYGGAQASISNAQDVSQLAGPAVDESVAYGDGLGAGVDVSEGVTTNSQGRATGPSGVVTGTVTGPFAVGGLGAAGIVTHTGVISMNCGG